MIEKIISSKPLSPRMLETLMECHEREIMKLDPCEASITKFAKGLLLRGLLTTNPYTTKSGKKILALYVTNLGKEYLSKI